VTAPLYNAEILRLAAEIPHHVRLDAPHATAERRSPICGSRVTVDVALGDDGRVAEVGLLVRACALGQASAEELAAARDALTAWLAAGEGDAPDWPGLAVFGPALSYTARHPSIRLAFEAAAEAAEQARERAVA
jgi:NifU-like protein involved in Fe-S cluster formation